MINIQKINLIDIILNEKYKHKEKSHENFIKLYTQIKLNGELQPLLVRKLEDDKYELIDGYERIKIYEKLQYEHCHANVLENISEKKAILLKLQMMLNFDFDVLETAKMMIELKEKLSPKQLERTIPFNEKQIERYQSIYEWDWSIFEYQSIPDEIKNNLGAQPKSSVKRLF